MFDPSKPADHSPLSSAEMRDQLTGLQAMFNTLNLTKANAGDVAAQISGTSSNSNLVDTMTLIVNDPPTRADVQSIADRLDQLINALRR